MTKAYSKWFIKNWYEAKGLIQPARAGDMVGLTGARITQIWSEQKMPIYKYKNQKPLIGWSDFINFKTQRESNKDV